MKRSEGGDIFSAIGAATGLGNAVRFPGLCAKYGLAFAAVYVAVCVLVCRPLLCAELCEGARGGRRRTVFVAAALNSAYTGVSYGAVVQTAAQCSLSYILPDAYGAPAALCCAAGAWAAAYFILKGGPRRMSVAGRLSLGCFACAMLPLAAFGALRFKPEIGLSSLLSPEMWAQAVCQAMLSLSLAQGVMPSFAAGMGKNFDAARCSWRIITANICACACSALAALPFSSGDGVGMTAAFALFPRIISAAFGLGVVGTAFGAAFFAMITVVALNSACALVYPAMPKSQNLIAAVCIASFALTPIMAADGGALLNACDLIACTFVAPIVALWECLYFARTRGGAALRFFCPTVCASVAAYSLCNCALSGCDGRCVLVAAAAMAALQAGGIICSLRPSARALTAGQKGGRITLWKNLKKCALRWKREVSKPSSRRRRKGRRRLPANSSGRARRGSAAR